jgi:hypothetical protein
MPALRNLASFLIPQSSPRAHQPITGRQRSGVRGNAETSEILLTPKFQCIFINTNGEPSRRPSHTRGEGVDMRGLDLARGRGGSPLSCVRSPADSLRPRYLAGKIYRPHNLNPTDLDWGKTCHSIQISFSKPLIYFQLSLRIILGCGLYLPPLFCLGSVLLSVFVHMCWRRYYCKQRVHHYHHHRLKLLGQRLFFLIYPKKSEDTTTIRAC